MHSNNVQSPTLMIRCCPIAHAMLYKYLGEKTVQTKRCVLSNVHASITKAELLVKKVVIIIKCFTNDNW